MPKYVFGYDFGTLSCRGIALNLATGDLCAAAQHDYRHGVISSTMYHKPIPLPDAWFLQDPEDWLESMVQVTKELLCSAAIAPEDVAAIGTDFTSCTMLPTRADGTPLCLDERFRDRPNAWPKLWKHHGAQVYAEEIERFAKAHTTWLKSNFGNTVSSEWMFPKVLQVVREDPDIYQAADLFLEAVDWIVFWLTGNLTRCEGVLGVNAFWVGGKGYPDRAFCQSLDPRLQNLVDEKFAGKVMSVGDCAGRLCEKAATRLGLSRKTVVSVGHSDGAVAGCGAGITESGSMMLVMGTSTCHQMMYDQFQSFDGICSVAKDGMIPGLYGYESGQPATGDIFAWFAEHLVPTSYYQAAEARGIPILQYLGDLAQALTPGESGLISLDWWNGNRSILSNYALSGLILGLTLQTRPEEIYRSLVEANIFGSRRILENYTEHGVIIRHIYAVGGIAKNSPWIMQMCADVFHLDVIVPLMDHVPARGAAACAAVALGTAEGYPGCADFRESSKRLNHHESFTYHPDAVRGAQYDRLYFFYCRLHDAFGMKSTLMEELHDFKNNTRIHSLGKEE